MNGEKQKLTNRLDEPATKVRVMQSTLYFLFTHMIEMWYRERFNLCRLINYLPGQSFKSLFAGNTI